MRKRMACAAVLAMAAAPLAAQGADTARYVERAVWLEVDGLRIPAAVTAPVQGTAASAVVLIPGSLFSDVDGDFPAFGWRPHAYADLARQLAARGHVVVRYAKPGPGTGTVVVDSARARAHLAFAERVVVAREAARVLRAQPGAAGLPLYLAGHSEGAVVASLAAAEEGLAGVVSLSGPSVGLLDIMREQLPPSADGAHPTFDAAVAALRAGRPLPPDAAGSPETRALARMDPRSLAYIREVDGVDPVAALALVRVPVLLVQGGLDSSVREHHARRLAAARAALPTETARFAELQHFYKRVPADMDPMQAMQVDAESDPAVANAIDRWIRARPARR